MTTISVAQLEEIAEAVGGSARTGYSGRFMFGKVCVGVVHEKHLGVALGVAIAQVLDDDLIEAMGYHAASDSMGNNTITYWPNVKIEEES